LPHSKIGTLPTSAELDRFDMPGEDPTLIYAELLSNIRQVSIGCQLPSRFDAGTEARLSSDGSKLTIVHRGKPAELKLPGTVVGPAILPIQSKDGVNLSWRLPLVRAAPEAPLKIDSEEVPWSARDLPTEISVGCRMCANKIIPGHRIKVWKDLPSENWAEMMEFWHCHKPDTGGHDPQQHLTSRGYGANSRISAQAGVGLIDLTSFLFHEDDCSDSAVCIAFARFSSRSFVGIKKVAKSAFIAASVAWSLIRVPNIDVVPNSLARPVAPKPSTQLRF
jgi:ubiquitin-protein ligase E3 D